VTFLSDRPSALRRASVIKASVMLRASRSMPVTSDSSLTPGMIERSSMFPTLARTRSIEYFDDGSLAS
jgi:hypothetical protein